MHLEARELGGRRHRVVHEVAGDRVAVGVVLHLLVQGLADACSHTAVLLALHEQRVQHGAAVVHRHMAQQRHLAGVLVDLDHGDVSAERERRTILREVELRRQPARAVLVIDDVLIRGGSIGGSRGERSPVERRGRRTGHTDGTGHRVDHDVGRVGFEQVSGQTLGLVDQRFGRLHHCRAPELQRTRAAGAAAAADEIGVHRLQPDAVDRDAGLVAHDHRERSLVALTVRRGAGHHGGRAVGVHFDGAVLAGASTCGDLHVRGHTDAQQRAVAASATHGLLATEVVIAHQASGLVERGGVRAAVVDDAGEGGEREHVVGEQVALAQLDRVDAQLECRLIDRTLQQRRGLGPAGSAVCPGGCRVGGGHGDVELQSGEPVRAVAHPPGSCRQECTEAGVRAAVSHQPHTQSGEDPLACAAELDVLDLRPAVGQREHVLAAGGDPRDRTTEAAGELGDDRLFGVEAGLAAEPATDVRCDHAQLGRLQAERPCCEALQQVRHLRAAVQHDATVVVHTGCYGMGLHRRHGDALVHVPATHHHVGPVELMVEQVSQHRVGRRQRQVVAVVLEDHRCAVGQCILGQHGGVERLVVDDHHVGSVLRLGDGERRHRHDPFAHEPHLVDCERRPGEVVVHLGHAVHRPQTEVGGGEHADDAGRPERCAGVDADDACVCHLGPHEHHVYRIGAEVVGTKVIDVSGGAEEQFGIFRAKHAGTEDRASHHRKLLPARGSPV